MFRQSVRRWPNEECVCECKGMLVNERGPMCKREKKRVPVFIGEREGERERARERER